MSSHHDCHCKHCSTNTSKRPTTQTPPEPARQTTIRVLKIKASDVFPVLKIPGRIASLAKHMMPVPELAFFAKAKSFHSIQNGQRYERGWNYVEEQHGRLVLVRKKKDALFDIHRGGWKRTKRRERNIMVPVESEPLRADPRFAEPRGGRVYIEDDSRGRIRVRRPTTAPAPFNRDPFDQHRHQDIHPRRVYIDEAGGRLVKKVPIRRAAARMQHQLHHDILEEDIYGDNEYEEEEDYYYEELMEPPIEMPTREPRPYHIPEPENSVWDEDLQAWMVNRRPRVRFG